MTSSGTVSTKLAMLAGTISTPSIRDFTIEMLKVASPSFGTARASRNNHPADEREPEGNALHTLRVAKLVRLIADVCDHSTILVDIVTSAALIHDEGRYGLDDEDEVTTKEHPLIPRKLAERHSITCEHANIIFDIVEAHMGRWGPTPHTPKISLDVVLHLADAISAHANEVWEPLGIAGDSWVGSVPFSVQGMTQDKMDLFGELAEGGGYWKTGLSFVRSVSSRKYDGLTEKQQVWIEKIIQSLGEELDKRTAKDEYLQ